MVARRYLISGRVQGVGFRYFVYRQAAELGVTGWVRNLPTGEVELRAEGDEVALQDFERRVAKGPSFSYVTGFEVEMAQPAAFTSFDIRR